MSLFIGEIATTLKMSENYPGLKKPMINGLFVMREGGFCKNLEYTEIFKQILPKIQIFDSTVIIYSTSIHKIAE